MQLDPDTVGDREFKTNDPLRPHKMWHHTRYTERFGLGIAATPTTQHVVLFQADKAGKLGDDISAACNVTGGGAADIDIDIKKNGSTILTAAMNVLGADGNRQQDAGTFSSAAAQAYAVGDVISADVSGTYTGAQGLMVNYSRVEEGD